MATVGHKQCCDSSAHGVGCCCLPAVATERSSNTNRSHQPPVLRRFDMYFFLLAVSLYLAMLVFNVYANKRRDALVSFCCFWRYHRTDDSHEHGSYSVLYQKYITESMHTRRVYIHSHEVKAGVVLLWFWFFFLDLSRLFFLWPPCTWRKHSSCTPSKAKIKKKPKSLFSISYTSTKQKHTSILLVSHVKQSETDISKSGIKF